MQAEYNVSKYLKGNWCLRSRNEEHKPWYLYNCDEIRTTTELDQVRCNTNQGWNNQKPYNDKLENNILSGNNCYGTDTFIVWTTQANNKLL